MCTALINVIDIGIVKFMASPRNGKAHLKPVKARAVTWLKNRLNQHHQHLP